MKASAICIALTIVLPAVLALPQPIVSTREGSLLRIEAKGKDEDPKLDDDEGIKSTTNAVWYPAVSILFLLFFHFFF